MKICIIKLGALGDVIRTTPIAEALKKKFLDCEITWITKKECLELLYNNPFINNLLSIPIEVNEKFDFLYNFDIEVEAINLALKINAEKKYGFYAQDGYPAAFNISAEYYLNTIFDDELKKTNKKTYQQMMFDVAELKFNKEAPVFILKRNEKKYGEAFLNRNKLGDKNIIGVHIGGGGVRWPSKAWSESKIEEFIINLRNKGHNILLFAGKDEIIKQNRIEERLKEKDIRIYKNNPENTIKEFASLLNICEKIICADSMALHMAAALKKKVVALFFCTSPDEIEDYGLIKKVVSPIIYEFFPEKSDEYNEELINSISVEEVLSACNL